MAVKFDDGVSVSGASTASRGASGASLKRLIYALMAISLGTIIEWYDFTIYTQMSKILSKAFFPANDPGLQALSFWGVFFVGYISRPLGAILFGHLGDTKGRGMCLLISVLVMGIPTVLIGCLPTYHQAGIVAPILLAILRLIQGLAMGGEFGAAMVYLHEIADPRYRALTGSLGYVSLGIGVVIGILCVTMIISLVPADAIAVWGWRLPFLFAIGTLAVAIIMRYNMPESAEFATSREEIDANYHKRIIKARSMRKAMRASRASSPSSRALSPSSAAAEKAAEEAREAAERAAAEQAEREAAARKLAESDEASSGDLESQASVLQKHYVPVFELLRGYWPGLILQALYEAWIGASFYLGYSWLPSFFATHAGIPTMMTLWMVLTSMVLFTFIVPISGMLADRGQPRVTATIVVCAIAAASSVPMFLAFQTRHLAACWLLQAFSLSLTAYTMGILPVICSSIYPAGVRISGFNLGYNIGMTIFGGLTPLIMTAIQTSTGSIFIGPGIWMTGMALTTIGASLALIRVYPLTNRFAGSE